MNFRVLVSGLDRIASSLEDSGLESQATVIREVTSFLKKSDVEISSLARDKDLQKQVLRFLWNEVDENGNFSNLIKYLKEKGTSDLVPNEFEENPRQHAKDLCKQIVKNLTGGSL
jgi:hypothetical protein